MMKELLKPMTAGASVDGDESDAGSGGVLADFATEALGQSLSNHGGLGIATSILRSLSRNGNDFAGFFPSGNGNGPLLRRTLPAALK